MMQDSKRDAVDNGAAADQGNRSLALQRERGVVPTDSHQRLERVVGGSLLGARRAVWVW